MKRFFALVALVLGLASCQTEPEGLDVQMGGAVDATITVSIPETETRYGASSKSAGSIFDNVDLGTEDDNNTMRYILQIYDATGQASKDRQIEYSDGRSVNFDVHLVPGRHYSFVVWADYVESKDDTDFHYYTKDGLTNITLNGTWDAMDETRDAFTGVFNTAVHGNQTEYNGAKDIDITLTRPFAKLRVRTTDMKELFGGVSPHNAEVRYTTPHYDTFDALRGVASGERRDVTHTYDIANYDDNVATGDKQTKTLFTDYFFANESGVVKFSMDVKEANGQSIKDNNFNTDIAVKRNHLTTIEGNILTDGNKVNVTVEDTFGKNDNQHIDYKTISSDVEFLAALNTTGKYVVISDLHIANEGDTVTTLATRAGGATTTIDLNGKTITVDNKGTGALASVTAGNTLVITNSVAGGKIELTKGSTGAFIENKGTVVIENGSIESESTNNAPVIENKGTTNITGGVIGDNAVENNETEGGKVNITGGTFESDPSEFVDSDYNVVENNGVYSLELKDVIAKIGEVEYRTLQKAFDAVDNGTIQLVGDVTLVETATLAEGKTATLDLNGKTLAHTDEANKYALSNLGTLTITGNGTVNSRGIYNGYGNGGENVATAKLTIENGSFNAKGTNGGAAVFNYGTANINGGSFTSIGGYSLNNQNGSSMTIADGVNANNGVYTSDATLTINGGEISGNRSGCHVIYCWNANITINGGTFYNNNHGNSTVMAAGTTTITYNGGTYGIKDGRVPGNGNTWTSCLLDSSDSATAVINGGTYNGGFRVKAGTSMTINGGSFNDCYGSAYNIYGTATVKGGTYTDAAAIAFAKKYLAEGYKVVENNGSCTVAVDPAAKIGETEYATLQEAFNVGGNITLLRNVTVAETVTLAEGKTAVLDLNGFNITVPEAGENGKHIYALNNTGIMTIKDSKGNGSISARGIYNGKGNDVANITTAKLTIESGKFIGMDSDGGAAIVNYGELIVNNGIFNSIVASINTRDGSKATINGGTYSGVAQGSYVIQNNGGELTIDNATVDSGFGAVGCYSGKTTINNGSFLPTGRPSATCHVVYVAGSADVTIKDGTFKMNYPTNAVPDSGSAVANYYKGTLAINGGTFYSHFDNVSPVELSSGSTITGGTYYNHSGEASQHVWIKNYIADGYELNANGEVVAK